MRDLISTYRRLLRQDYLTFLHRSFLELHPETRFEYNWHLEILAEALQDCMEGRTRRLIINIPPRSMKSIAASVALPAYWLGHHPSTQMMCVSYGQDLSQEFARHTRNLMQSPFYKQLFETRIAPDKMAVNDFATTANGYRLAVSVGGPVTGRGADVIIIDDPLKPDEALSEVRRRDVNEFYQNTLLSRLNNKQTGCIILIMQRLHQDDLAGHILEQEDWKVLSFPAIAEENEEYEVRTALGTGRFGRTQGEALQPNREPLEALDRLRRTMSDYNFQAQYQQNPMPPGGAMIKTRWLCYYKPEDLPENGYLVQSWDTAIKAHQLADYSVCVTCRVTPKGYYIIDVYRERLEYPDLKRAVQTWADKYNPQHILIEDKASGAQLIQDLKRDGVYAVTPYETPNYQKEMRVNGQTAEFENGFVHLPETARWLDEYVRELTGFPGAKHDDQVDATIQILDRFKRRIGVWDMFAEWDEQGITAEDLIPDPRRIYYPR